MEICNDVFMEYNKLLDGKFVSLTQKTSIRAWELKGQQRFCRGLMTTMTEIFQPIIREIEKASGKSYSVEEYKRPMRIIADHIRAVVAIAGDRKGIRPRTPTRGIS